ncbi:TolC family outer membrane protein [Methylovulum psychrotolerans]|uniref:TolC family outer membrane protein n=1 Tax=Methylovulum psychrotolerans TaxID=1704499 RepID=UPI001BFFCCBA|nr:TolC family outer membrane protein [Methylovulum psychrotolerans]MBT9098678.1 TolC family outer membrane protein [Methylovulum psychrotolerans]
MRYPVMLPLLAALSLPAAAEDLLSLYERAVLASPELGSSEYSLDIIKAQEDQSFGKLLPEVSVVGNYSLNEYHQQHSTLGRSSNSSYPGTRASITLQQPIFDLQAYLLMKSQQAKTSQYEENLLAAHQKLVADLLERYVNALKAQDKSEIIAAELASTEKQLARVEAMSQRQLAMITDKYELQARTETLRTNLIDNDNDARIALEKLRELTGDAVGPVQPVRMNAVQLPPEGSVDTWVKQAGQINPELQGLKHAVESARQSISAYQAGHLPRIELQLSGTYSDTVYNNLTSSPYDIGSASVQAVVPIYEGGITSAKVREAQARKKLAEAELEKKLREFEQITRAAYLDMVTSPKRSQATDRQLQASEQSRDAMKKGYELGVVTIVDLLNAEKQLSEARQAQREARYRYFTARSSLYFQTGRLIGDELLKFNQWLVADVRPGKKTP